MAVGIGESVGFGVGIREVVGCDVGIGGCGLWCGHRRGYVGCGVGIGPDILMWVTTRLFFYHPNFLSLKISTAKVYI